MPRHPHKLTIPASPALTTAFSGSPSFQHTYASTAPAQAKQPKTKSIASYCCREYNTSNAAPIDETRAMPICIVDWAGPETAIRLGSPNEVIEFWGLMRETVPPRVMEVAKRRAGRWRGTKLENISDVFVYTQKFFTFELKKEYWVSLMVSFFWS